MAEIKMDVSEYETLKENKKLLEESLAKERGLNEQIQLLKEEKIKALEDAKMKVVKTTRRKTEEFIVSTHLSGDVRYEVERAIYSLHSIPRPTNLTDTVVEVLKKLPYDKLFNKIKATGIPDETITEVIGFDEYKEELRTEFENKYENIYKDKLERLKKLDKELPVVRKENNSLKEDNINFVNTVRELEESNKEANEEVKALSIKIDTIKQITKDGYGMWGKGNMLDDIINVIDW